MHPASLGAPPCGQPRLHHCCSLVAWRHRKSRSSAQRPGSWCWRMRSRSPFPHLKCTRGKSLLKGKDLTQRLASPPQIWLGSRVPAPGSSSTLNTIWTVQRLFLACTFVTFYWLAALSKSSIVSRKNTQNGLFTSFTLLITCTAILQFGVQPCVSFVWNEMLQGQWCLLHYRPVGRGKQTKHQSSGS